MSIKEDLDLKLRLASWQILERITPRRQAQYVLGVSILLGVAKIIDPSIELPPQLAAFAAGVGGLGSLVRDIADGKKESSDDILETLDEILPETALYQLMKDHSAALGEIVTGDQWQALYRLVEEQGEEGQQTAVAIQTGLGEVGIDVREILRLVREEVATKDDLAEQTEEIVRAFDRAAERWRPPVYTPPPLPDRAANGRPPTQPTGPLPPGSRLPYQPNPFFTGREADLADLALALLYDTSPAPLPSSQTPAPSLIISTGIGGVGKTQLAAEFAHRWGRYFSGVHWVSLADPTTVEEEVAACGLAMGLGAAFSELPTADKVAAVGRVWAGPERRLLLFDNCEEPALLRQWRPSSGGCVVLVTSRRESWEPSLGVRTRHLEPFDVPDSVALLRKHLAEGDGRPPRTDLTDDQLAAIARELGELPLALRLAGGYLRRYKRVSAADYLAALQQPDLLSHASLLGDWADHSSTDHDLSVARTFAVSFEQLRPDEDATDAAARDLLARAACFAPGEPLPDDLLLAALETEPPTLADDGLERLLALGLLERTGPESVRLHRLLARYVAGELAAVAGEEDRMAAAQAAVEDAVIVSAYEQNDGGLPSALVSLGRAASSSHR